MLRLHDGPTSGRFRIPIGTEVVLDLTAPGDCGSCGRGMQIAAAEPRRGAAPLDDDPQQVGRPLALPQARPAGPRCGDRVVAIAGKVGLRADHGTGAPHEFSGGQRQRIAIARGLITRRSS